MSHTTHGFFWTSVSLLLLLVADTFTLKENATSMVFEKDIIAYPAAFGDMNGDKRTDMFLINENQKGILILTAPVYDGYPYITYQNVSCSCFNKSVIVSLVPADFNGDMVLDLLVVTKQDLSESTLQLFLFYGDDSHKIHCESVNKPLLSVNSEPLILDYNSDAIADMLTTCGNNSDRCLWIFHNDNNIPPRSERLPGSKFLKLQSNAVVDLNRDNMADLFITSEDSYEMWFYSNGKFSLSEKVYYSSLPKNTSFIGQSAFVDISQAGNILHMIPICEDVKCERSFIYVYEAHQWMMLDITFVDKNNSLWGFVPPDGQMYTETITLRTGDFTTDGFPDVLVTLQNKTSPLSIMKVFLLKNIPCNKCRYKRTFEIQWKLLDYWYESRLGAFFDFYDTGILDVLLLVKKSRSDDHYSLIAFQNLKHIGSTYLRVFVFSRYYHMNCSHPINTPYSTNYPGATACYTVQGDVALEKFKSCAVQLYRTSHNALQLPYIHFGMGRYPKYIDDIHIGLPVTQSGVQSWNHLFPNSEVVGIPYPINTPEKWVIRIFITKFVNVYKAVAGLLGLIAFCLIVIGLLHWREKVHERRQEQATQFKFVYVPITN